MAMVIEYSRLQDRPKMRAKVRRQRNLYEICLLSRNCHSCGNQKNSLITTRSIWHRVHSIIAIPMISTIRTIVVSVRLFGALNIYSKKISININISIKDNNKRKSDNRKKARKSIIYSVSNFKDSKNSSSKSAKPKSKK